MKKAILILACSLALVSCGNKETKEQIEAKQIFKEAKAEAFNHSLPSIDFSNPALIGGSNFGNFFISMVKTQNYDMALKFTSTESKNKFGTATILAKYRDFNFNYKLGNASISKAIVGDTLKYILTYTTNEYATGKIKEMTLVVENDSCKLVLPDNLNDLLK
jgi:hypothetical protein